jgi:O-antigen/teichoic acid export membrane protein
LIKKQENLLGGRRLTRNVFWNLIGTGAPLLVAIVAIPMLIEGLGTARFGVLALAWMFVGYFSLFDFGLGRALTKHVAEKLGENRREEIPTLVWTAISMMTVLGVLGSVSFAALSPWMVDRVLRIPTDLQSETLNAFYLLAIAIPIVIGATGLRGILEAYQRFDFVNVVRIPLGFITFAGPVAVLPFSNSLVPVVAVLCLARLISWCVYAIMCGHVEPSLQRSIRFDRELVGPLISFGGWMTVSNIVGPLMVYMDRFLIGAVVSITAVAYYATPYEVVTKLGIIPAALMGVVFPAFAAAFVRDRAGVSRLFNRTVNYVFLSLFPIVLIIVTLAREGMTLWLGSEFAGNSTLVIQLLAIGVFINSHAQVPFGLLQSAGRPDITAKLHLIELTFYLVLLWWLLGTYGIVGAAIAWVVRVSVDAMLLFVLAHELLSVKSPFTIRPVLATGMVFVLFALGAIMRGIVIKGLFLQFTLLLFAFLTWFFFLGVVEKNLIRNRLKAILVFH